MIYLAGEPDDIWWNGEVQEVYLGADLIWKSGPTIEAHEVSRSGMYGSGTFHSLITLSPPQGEQWHIRIEGVFSAEGSFYPTTADQPVLTIGAGSSSSWGEGASASYEGVVSPSNSSIGVTTNSRARSVNFVGTVTVTKP